MGEKGPSIGAGSTLQDRPVLSALLIAILAGLLLQISRIFVQPDLLETSLSEYRLQDWIIDSGFRMAMGAVLVLVAVPLLLGYYRAGWFSKYRSRMRLSLGPHPARTVVAGILSLVAFIVVLSVFSHLSGVFRFDPSSLIDDQNWIILLIALTPGIWEELAFRGIVLSNLEQRFPRWRAITISSIAFGLYHLSSLWVWDDPAAAVAGVILATATGMGWGYLAVSAKSVVPTMVLHYAVNVILFDEIFVAPSAGDDSTGKIYLALAILYPLLTILFTRLVFKTRPTNVREPPGSPLSSPGNEAEGDG